MEEEPTPEAPLRPSLRLQAATFPSYSVPSFPPSFKLDEGYSDETRSQPDKEPVPDNVMILPDWMLAQSEADRAGKNSRL